MPLGSHMPLVVERVMLPDALYERGHNLLVKAKQAHSLLPVLLLS